MSACHEPQDASFANEQVGHLGFMVPMHSNNRKRAFHEPTVWSPGFSRSGPPEGGTPNRPEDPDGFVVPMHGNNDIHAFHGNALAPGKPIRSTTFCCICDKSSSAGITRPEACQNR